jgi:hypothetical protein
MRGGLRWHKVELTAGVTPLAPGGEMALQGDGSVIPPRGYDGAMLSRGYAACGVMPLGADSGGAMSSSLWRVGAKQKKMMWGQDNMVKALRWRHRRQDGGVMLSSLGGSVRYRRRWCCHL